MVELIIEFTRATTLGAHSQETVLGSSVGNVGSFGASPTGIKLINEHIDLRGRTQ